MQIIGHPPSWNKSASDLLKQFLDSSIGSVFLANLSSRRPSFSVMASTEAVALRAQEIAGYEKCLSEIVSLASVKDEDPDTKAPEPYPDLDEKTGWEDIDKKTEQQRSE